MRRLLRGQATMRRIAEFLEANTHRPIRLVELCAIAGCSAKTLERLFLECIGGTPNRYLRRYRLWRARTLLAAADPAATTVASIALDCGFWELGRFAGAYRALFGESPSQTLRGRAHAAARHPLLTKTALMAVAAPR